MSNLTWWLRMSILAASASFRFAVDDPRLFARKVVERFRASNLRYLAELVQSRLNSRTVEQSQVQREFARKNYANLASMRSGNSSQKLNRSETRLVNRAAELDQLLTSRTVHVTESSTSTNTLSVLFYLTNSLPHTQSGYAFRTQSTLSALSRAGVKVSAVTRLGYPITVGRFARESTEQVDGISYHRLVPYHYPASVLERHTMAVEELTKIAIDTEATILHTTTDYHNAMIVAEVASKLKIPWVYEVRGELERTWLSKQDKELQDNPENSYFYLRARAKEAECMNAANAVVALSEVSRQQLTERGVDPRKIVVLPNAVDESTIALDYDKNSIRNELDLPDDRIVGSVTSVVEYEGLDDLIRALQQGLNATVLIVGDGDFLPQLKKLASELGVLEKVIFAGRQENDSIWKWYAAMDVFVVPRKDTLVCRTVTPMKPVLAMALGIPVVASDLPALREITGGLATYYSAESPKELSAALNLVFEDEMIIADKIEWARNHTWRANAERLKELYNWLFT